MKKWRVFCPIMFVFSVSIFLQFLIVHGSGGVMSLFDDSNAYYQLKKSVVWAVSISFFLMLVLTQIIIQINVNRRKNAEMSLLGSEEVLKTLINGTPDLIFFKDANGRYLEINDSMLNLFGFNIKNYRGKLRQELDETSPHYKAIRESCLISDEKAWEKGSVYRTTEILDMPGGVKRIYDVIKAPIFYKYGSKRCS